MCNVHENGPHYQLHHTIHHVGLPEAGPQDSDQRRSFVLLLVDLPLGLEQVPQGLRSTACQNFVEVVFVEVLFEAFFEEVERVAAKKCFWLFRGIGAGSLTRMLSRIRCWLFLWDVVFCRL
jgi:hypothetical protein